MGDISLALCIPTYERSKMVEDFLINCSAYYIEAGIDIYYYDSSVGDETEKIVCNWPHQEHVHYIRMSSRLHPNQKAYRIFQQYGLKREYDFIWLTNDGLQCSRMVINQLMSNLSLDYDIIELNHKDRENIGTRVFTDPNEYMQLCAWHLGLFGAAVLNWHTILSGVDWAYYESKFLTPTLMNFSHVSFYFYRILELEQFHALYLSFSITQIGESKLKKDIGWRKEFFFVLCEGWVKTIEGLPNFYTNKKSACVKLGDLSLLPGIDWFYLFRKSGLYSLDIYRKYRKVWSKVTSLPSVQLFVAACAPKPLIDWYEKKRRASGVAKLKKFCSTYPRIIIYGTGVTGAIYDQYFRKCGLSYDAFCVSHRKPDKTEYLQHPVYEFSEIRGDLNGTGIVIALMEDNADEVLSVISDCIASNCIFYEPEFVKNIRRKYGCLC